ncbi:unnamed protein product [Caenorhabditis auriculariae]|uniref:Chromo domain-containing protein n=1 Tax=Caenorhabditis auriculariae TaxID=2777116 RepID=A0A8S1HM30_9PELO|nr:unnamed protein product [Caenorhabditis auriculariae]
MKRAKIKKEEPESKVRKREYSGEDEIPDRIPVEIVTDKGKEFYNAQIQRLFKFHHIRHYTPKTELKAAMVERANRTLKTRLAKYMTFSNSHRYIDALPAIVFGINHTVNRGIGKKPVQVSNGEFIGDTVRISKLRKTFDKGYEKGFSEELFKISDILPSNPVTYRLKDLKDEPIDGKFYEQELTRYTESTDVFKVEKILAKRRVKGKRQCLVRWYGYPPEFDSWVNESELHAI